MKTSERYVFPALFASDAEGEIIVTFPDLPEAVTFGRSEEEALGEAQDCLREALRGRMRDHEDIPQPSRDVPEARLIAPPAEIAAKAAVYEAFKRAGVSRVALADRLHVHEGEVRRILDPNHRTKLERLDEAARALGGRLEVSFVPADEDG